MPLQRRIPKGGFAPLRRVEYQVVNLRALSEIEDAEITPEVLRNRGLTGSLKRPVKVLGDGDIDRPVKVSAHAFSGSARAKIEAAGGSVTKVDR
jgi:large subunit ribosomal protein L15